MVQGVNEVHEHCSGPDRWGTGKGVLGVMHVQGTAPLENFGKHLKIRVPPFYPSYLPYPSLSLRTRHERVDRDYVPWPLSIPQEGP